MSQLILIAILLHVQPTGENRQNACLLVLDSFPVSWDAGPFSFACFHKRWNCQKETVTNWPKKKRSLTIRQKKTGINQNKKDNYGYEFMSTRSSVSAAHALYLVVFHTITSEQQKKSAGDTPAVSNQNKKRIYHQEMRCKQLPTIKKQLWNGMESKKKKKTATNENGVEKRNPL